MSIPFISYICSIYSRLAYLNPREFNDTYSEVFSDKNKIITDQMTNFNDISLTNFFNIETKNIMECNKIVNRIIYSKQKKYIENQYFTFFSLSTSNYSGVFIIADKRTNMITVAFRGTYSAKSALSYSNLSSTKPTLICDKNGFLIGVFKIIHEIFNTILECIHFLRSDFLKSTPTIITTGHSLGGACATIFSYLYYLNERKRICCITFGAPRVFNYDSIQIFNSFIIKNKILFHRYVTNGDPFAKLPPNIPKLTTKTFYHPDDHNIKFENVSYLCNNQTKKIVCTFKSKTKKRKPNLEYHGNYLGVSYKGAADDLKNLKKEIKRNKAGDTVCRLVRPVGDKIETVFYNLQELKHQAYKSKSRTAKLKEKIGKVFKTDYKRGDIFMNKTQLAHLIKNMFIMKEVNELDTDNYTDLLENQKPQKIKICYSNK